MKKTTQVENVVVMRARQQVGNGSEKLFFLFTTSQVEEVLADLIVRPLPFAPAYLQGISYWRESLLPVIDLGKRVIHEDNERPGEQSEKSRFIVVRAGTKESTSSGNVFRCILKLSDEIYSMDISTTSFVAEDKHPDLEPSLLRGTYRWNDDLYVVPDLVSILQNQPAVER